MNEIEKAINHLTDELLRVLKIKKKVIEAFDHSNREEEDLHAHLQMIFDDWMIKVINESSY